MVWMYLTTFSKVAQKLLTTFEQFLQNLQKYKSRDQTWSRLKKNWSNMDLDI